MNDSKKPPKKSRRYPRFPAPGVTFPGLDMRGPVTLSTFEASEVTGCTVHTVNRWRRTGVIPGPCLRLLQLHQAGYVVPPDWRRAPCAFTRTGSLVIGGYVFARGELEGYGVMLQALRSLQREREAASAGTVPASGRPALVLLPGGQSGA